MTVKKGWLTPKTIMVCLAIFGFFILGVVVDPDRRGGSDRMTTDAAQAATLYTEYLQLASSEMNDMASSLQNKKALKPNAARKERMNDLSEKLEAIKAKYSGSKQAEFKALMDEAMK